MRPTSGTRADPFVVGAVRTHGVLQRRVVVSDDVRATPDTGFKLRPLIRAVLTESKSTDVVDLAHEVLAQIASYDRETALFQALVSLVKESTVGQRPSFLPPAAQHPSHASVTPVSPVASERDGRQWLRSDGSEVDDATEARQRVQEARAARPVPTRPKPSSKVSAIRDAWQRTLDQRLVTESGQKFLRDCTIPDLEFAATARERLARQAADRAGDLRQLVEKMRQHHATTLGEVPAEALRDMTDTLARVAA